MPACSWLEKLDWDTQFFGFFTGSVDWPHATWQGLGNSLKLARETGLSVVYVQGPCQPQMPAKLLKKYGGRLIETRHTFRLECPGLANQSAASPPAASPPAASPPAASPPAITNPVNTPCAATSDSVSIVERAPLEPDEALVQLALVAGQFSRFRRDPRFGQQAFERLYRAWIHRACQERAGSLVLVAQGADRSAPPVGLVTAEIPAVERREYGWPARIGLLAVDPSHHRQGISRALLAHLADRLWGQGVHCIEVVTQAENLPACRAYAAAGYHLASSAAMYHFWIDQVEQQHGQQ